MPNLKPVLLMAAITAAGIMASGAGAQVAPQATQWGEPVEGVQLRLTSPTDTALLSMSPRGSPALGSPLRGVLPPLVVQVWNQGSTSVTADPYDLIYPMIEIDDVWYAQVYGGSSARPIDIAPGSQGDAIGTGHSLFHMFELGATPARPYEYRPGPRRVRVRAVVSTTSGMPLTLVSNRITVIIPDLFAYGATVDGLALGIWNEEPEYQLDERKNVWITLRNTNGGAVAPDHPLLRESWLYITNPAGEVGKVAVRVPRGSGAGDFSFSLDQTLHQAIRQRGKHSIQWKAGPAKPGEVSNGSPAHRLESGLVTFNVAG
jgi:hypothetical protein